MNIIHFIKLFFFIVAFLMKAHALGDLELEQRAGPELDLFSFLPWNYCLCDSGQVS